MMRKVHVSDIMTTCVQTINSADSAEYAWHVMRQRHIHHLVVTQAATIVGMLSAFDLGGPRGEAFRVGRRVEELMVRSVKTVQPDYTMRQAAEVMRELSIGCLPVVSRGKLIGIVTNSDLLALTASGELIPALFAARPFHRSSQDDSATRHQDHESTESEFVRWSWRARASLAPLVDRHVGARVDSEVPDVWD